MLNHSPSTVAVDYAAKFVGADHEDLLTYFRVNLAFMPVTDCSVRSARTIHDDARKIIALGVYPCVWCEEPDILLVHGISSPMQSPFAPYEQSRWGTGWVVEAGSAQHELMVMTQGIR